MNLADTIVKLRGRRGYTQEQLANRSLGVALWLIKGIESCSATPTVSELGDIANALDATLVIRLVPNEAEPD